MVTVRHVAEWELVKIVARRMECESRGGVDAVKRGQIQVVVGFVPAIDLWLLVGLVQHVGPIAFRLLLLLSADLTLPRGATVVIAAP